MFSSPPLMNNDPFPLRAALAALCLVPNLSESATIFSGINISFNEAAFPSSTTAISGPQSYNVINDTTASKIASWSEFTSLIGDESDIHMNFQSSLGPLGSASWQWQPEFGGRFIANHGYSGTVGVNNPGTIISNSVTLTFGDHLTVTDLSLRAQSINTRGLAWEYTLIEFLRPDGSSFSTAPVIGDYLSHTSINGSPSTGWYVLDAKSTVSGVGTDRTVSSLSGSGDNIAGLGYAEVGLAPGTVIGGIRITTYLQDVRGTSNGPTNLTSSFIDFTFSGSVVPEPTSALLAASGLGMTALKRRRTCWA